MVASSKRRSVLSVGVAERAQQLAGSGFNGELITQAIVAELGPHTIGPKYSEDLVSPPQPAKSMSPIHLVRHCVRIAPVSYGSTSREIQAPKQIAWPYGQPRGAGAWPVRVAGAMGTGR